MMIKKAILISYNAGTYKAILQMAGSDKAYLEGVAIAKNMSSAAMVAGCKLAVLFFDENNAAEAGGGGVVNHTKQLV